MKKLKLLFFLNLLPYLLFAQDSINSRQLFLRAEYHLFNKEYYDAMRIYLSLLKTDAQNRNLNFHIGLCCLNTDNYNKALQHFQLYDKHINIANLQDTNKYGFSGIYLYLGKTYKLNNRLKNPGEEEGYKINPYKTAYDVIMSGSDSILIITSKEGADKIVSFSRKSGDVWRKPENITSQLGVNNDYFISSLSYDGKRLYASKYDNFEADIYVSHYNGKSWTGFEKLDGNINTRYWDSHACETPDGQVLYFASNRPGGFGGMDIYYSQKDEKGRWGRALNAGSIINTRLSEENPYVTNEGRTLFFSSQGHGGEGGYDIFYSNRTFTDQFTKPQNVGFPVSTADDDMAYHPLTRESQAFYALIAENEKNSSVDYRKKNKLQIIGFVDFPDSTGDYSKVKVSVIDNFTNDTIKVLTPEPFSKSFTCQLTEGNYVLVYEAEGYKTKNDYILIPFVLANDAMSIHASFVPLVNRIVPRTVSKVSQITATNNSNTWTSKSTDARPDEDGKIYTVQITILRNDAETMRYKNIPEVCITKEDNGVYKVTLGRYTSLLQARKKLIELKGKGYKDALVIELDPSKDCNKK